MNIQIFGSSKSFDTKKAERWFKERRIKYQYIDVPSKGLSPREYQSVKQKVGFSALVNTKCRAYEDLFMAYITPDAQEEKLLEHPELFQTPIVRNGKEATVGYCPEVWAKWEQRGRNAHTKISVHSKRGKGERLWSGYECRRTASCGGST